MEKFTRPLTRKFKRLLYCLLTSFIISLSAYSQNAGISPSGVIPPDPAAGLDINFTDKGLLIPRVNLTSTTSFAPLAAHVAGMLVYNTATGGDVTPGFYVNNGTKWVPGLPKAGTATGMQYWDGNAWATIPPGNPGQRLQLNSSGVPTWAP